MRVKKPRKLPMRINQYSSRPPTLIETVDETESVYLFTKKVNETQESQFDRFQGMAMRNKWFMFQDELAYADLSTLKVQLEPWFRTVAVEAFDKSSPTKTTKPVANQRFTFI